MQCGSPCIPGKSIRKRYEDILMKPYTYIIAARRSQAPSMQYFFALSQVLVERGHQVIIIVDGQRHDVENHQVNPAIYTWPSIQPTHWRDALFLYKLVRKFHPDALIANFNNVNIMLLVGWLSGVPVRVAWYRSLLNANLINIPKINWITSFLIWRRQLVYKLATHLIANSFAAREDVIKEYHVPARRAYVIHNSMADPLPSLRNSEKDRNLLVCVGRITLSKGQDILIRAVSLLRSSFPDLKVELIGKITQEGYQQSVQDLARQLGVAEICIFTGALSHGEVLERMSHAWVTLFPTRSEAFGLVNIESMAVGTPVIASKVGGIPEVIRDKVDGFLVPPEDPDHLAEAIRTLLRDDHLHEQMSLSCRQRFLELFERDKVINDQADWFIGLVSDANKVQ